MTGLCGDCNGSLDDDLNTHDGSVTTGTAGERHTEVGDSYMVIDTENENEQ